MIKVFMDLRLKFKLETCPCSSFPCCSIPPALPARLSLLAGPSLRGVGLINCEENIFEVCTKKEVQEEFGELMCQLFIRENYEVVIHNSTKMGKKGTYCEVGDFCGGIYLDHF